MFNSRRTIHWPVFVLVAIAAGVHGGDAPIAEWNFDDTRPELASDSSGYGHHARLFGAKRVPQGRGNALFLDGIDDYADCGKLPLGGAVSVEFWVKPLRKGHGLACIMGEELTSFLVTYYNTEVCDFFLGGGGNNTRGRLDVDAWNHVAASFDGQRLLMWVNGRETSNQPSRFTTYKPSGQFIIGTKEQPALPRFKGLLDRVRVYDRALDADEVTKRYRAESEEYGIDPAWFSRVRTTLWEYLDAEEPHVAVEADYRELLPLRGNGRIEVQLASAGNPGVTICEQVIDPAPARLRFGGIVEAVLPCENLADGKYVVRVKLTDAGGEYPIEELSFTYPPNVSALPAPKEQKVAALRKTKRTNFGFRMFDGGGFEIEVNGSRYPFETRFSWPNGQFNQLIAGERTVPAGEPAWQVRTRQLDRNRWLAESAGGAHYRVSREVTVRETHVLVKDAITNLTEEDLGLLVYHQTPVQADQLTGSWLSGYDRRGRQAELTYPDYAPSAFYTDARAGMGIVPLDDVFIVQGVPYVGWQESAGICTEKFALPPRGSYTLEWAVYPVASREYYDFVNAFRRAEGRIGRIDGAPGYITRTLRVPWRRELPDAGWVARRNLRIGIMHNLAETADDPALSIEGIEFVDFPMEMAAIKEQRAKLREQFPGLKAIFHVAHSLYCTNQPDRFSDSKVVLADGSQATWDDGSAFGAQRKAEGWRWWIYYPTPGNSFHDALLKSVDVMMDELGMDGAFMDGFLAGYCGHWSYDTAVRWDGHSAEIHPGTKTITRKINSVILLSQPSMVEFARKIRDKGGIVVAMHNVLTRTIAKEKHLIFANECASGPELHLAPNMTVLGANQGFRSERQIYLDILDKLRWGELYLHYLDGMNLTHESLAARQYPITIEEIGPGIVRGPERIVTMIPGVYGWPDGKELHRVLKFDSRGAPAAHRFVSTVDDEGVRTDLALAKDESAVIEPIPVRLSPRGATNVRVDEYGPSRLSLVANGGGGSLRVTSGEFPVADGGLYRVAIGNAAREVRAQDAAIVIDVERGGPVNIKITPAGHP